VIERLHVLPAKLLTDSRDSEKPYLFWLCPLYDTAERPKRLLFFGFVYSYILTFLSKLPSTAAKVE
jgi:hypothetical protein